MKLSETIIQAIKETRGQYRPEYDDALVGNLIKKITPFVKAEPDLLRAMSKRIMTSREPALETAKVIADLTNALVGIAFVSKELFKGDAKQNMHEAIDMAWPVQGPPVKPLVTPKETPR